MLTKLFADDTCLIFLAKTIDELQIVINREMLKIHKWMVSNKLSINYSKTKYMLIHRQHNQTPFSLYINDHKIDKVSCIEYVGVKIDDKLTWKEHIKHIKGKLSSACGAMYRLRQTVSQECLRSFYFAHAYFHLQYSILAWSNTHKQYLQRLNSLHGKLIRLMTLHGPLKNFYFSANEMLKNMDLLKPDDIVKLELAKFMHRAESKIYLKISKTISQELKIYTVIIYVLLVGKHFIQNLQRPTNKKIGYQLERTPLEGNLF